MKPMYKWAQAPFEFKYGATTSKNVYEPSTDTFTLIDALYLDKEAINSLHPQLCCEIGVGFGYALISLHEIAKCKCIGTDINIDAVNEAKNTVKLYKYEHDIAIVNTNILDGVDGLFDVIIINPPYVPTTQKEMEEAQKCPGIISSWAGGEKGMGVYDKMLECSMSKLKPNGIIYSLLTGLNPKLKYPIVTERHMGNEQQIVYKMQKCT